MPNTYIRAIRQIMRSNEAENIYTYFLSGPTAVGIGKTILTSLPAHIQAERKAGSFIADFCAFGNPYATTLDFRSMHF